MLREKERERERERERKRKERKRERLCIRKDGRKGRGVREQEKGKTGKKIGQRERRG